MTDLPNRPVAAAPAIKHDVLSDLEEPALLLPTLVNRGLEANDRAKYWLALLQASQVHATAPTEPFSSLRDERLAAGLTDDDLDTVVERSHRAEGREGINGSDGSEGSDRDYVMIPGAGRIHDALTEAVAAMLEPFATANGDAYRSRLQAHLAAAPALTGDRVPCGYIDTLVCGDRSCGDSMHLLVMDAHRALNRLQEQIATATIDGAVAYGLDPEDEALVRAFMAGVHATAALKFNHPGLGTTATRVGRRLLLQNDIGETEAHVIVIAVDDLVATITYTDVHRRRLVFFQSLLDCFDVRWSDTQRRGSTRISDHYLTTGRYEAPGRESLTAYLQHLGSRLVFLLDWNRARKRLAPVVGNAEAVDLLRWAADTGCGHMAFLLLGGEQLVYDAVELAAKVPARYGEPLRDVLGFDDTLAVLRFALQAAADGLLHGKSHALIRDELRVEVRKHVRAAQSQLLGAGAEHGSLIVEAAQALRSALLRLSVADGEAYLNRASKRAARWEHRADEVLIAVRQEARRVDGAEAVVGALSNADDAIDGFEEALSLLVLLPKEAADAVRPILDPLAAVAVAAAREHLKALEIARELIEGAGGDDVEDFLVAVDQVATLEHDADEADRCARAGLVTQSPDFRTLHVADLVAHTIEDATDALLRSAFGLREHVLGQVSAR